MTRRDVCAPPIRRAKRGNSFERALDSRVEPGGSRAPTSTERSSTNHGISSANACQWGFTVAPQTCRTCHAGTSTRSVLGRFFLDLRNVVFEVSDVVVDPPLE